MLWLLLLGFEALERRRLELVLGVGVCIVVLPCGRARKAVRSVGFVRKIVPLVPILILREFLDLSGVTGYESWIE